MAMSMQEDDDEIVVERPGIAAEAEEQVDVDTDEDESRARAERMGWADQEHWRGDPDKWVDHNEFLKRGEERLPVLQERLHATDSKLAAVQKELRQVIRQQGEWERTERQRLEAEFEERKRKAVEEADTTAYDAAASEERKWREQQQAAATAPAADPDFLSWQERNDWYGGRAPEDKRMTRYANQAGAFIIEDQPELQGTPGFYDEVESMVRQQFPDRFTNPRRNQPNGVAGARGGQGAGAGRKSKPTYADLPSAAKKKCDEYVANKWVTRDEYVAEFFAQGNQS